MRDKELEKYLYQSLGQETEAKKKEETIKLCTGIVKEQKSVQRRQEEVRTGFIQYLSDIFRYEGVPVFGLQAVTLFMVCLIIFTVADIPQYIPIFMPLFVLAAVPVMFKSQYYGMCEIEAVTRASNAQIILAKLILAGAANLVCMTALISLEAYLQNSCGEIGQMILYCLVPYLVCMVSMLRLIRLCRKESMQICLALMLGFCMGFWVLARLLPGLYAASAFGLWIVAFLISVTFFIKEIYFIAAMRKEGKMYGIIS